MLRFGGSRFEVGIYFCNFEVLKMQMHAKLIFCEDHLTSLDLHEKMQNLPLKPMICTARALQYIVEHY